MKFLRFCLLFLLFLRLISFFLSKPILKSDDLVKVEGIITSAPKIGYKTAEIEINDEYIVQTDLNFKGQNIKYKKIVAIGKVICQKTTSNPCQQVIKTNNFKIYSNGLQEKLQLFFDDLRENVKAVYFKYLPDEEAQIVSGIFLGDAKGITPGMYDAFKKTGTLHLFAASGMNLVLFCGFWLEVLNLFFKRRQAVLLSVFTCVFYIFLTGFSSSILRAGVMFIFAIFAHIIGRPIKAFNNLAKSAGVLVFISPNLTTSLGFQLSVLSTLAIITLPSNLNSRTIELLNDREATSMRRLLDKLWGVVGADFGVSTACFLFTAPVILFSFNQINLISPLVNILVLWTVDLIMIFGGAIAILNYVFPEIIASSLIKALIFAFYPTIYWFKEVIMHFSKLNFGVINLREGASLGSLLTFSLVIWTIFLFMRHIKHEQN